MFLVRDIYFVLLKSFLLTNPKILAHINQNLGKYFSLVIPLPLQNADANTYQSEFLAYNAWWPLHSSA